MSRKAKERRKDSNEKGATKYLSLVSLLVGTLLTLGNIGFLYVNWNKAKTEESSAEPRFDPVYVLTNPLRLRDTLDRQRTVFLNAPLVENPIFSLLNSDSLAVFTRRNELAWLTQIDSLDQRLIREDAERPDSIRGDSLPPLGRMDPEITLLYLKNIGTRTAENVVLEVDCADLPDGGFEVEQYSNLFPSLRNSEVNILRTKSDLPLGNIGPGAAVLVPVYLSSYMGTGEAPDLVIFGKVYEPLRIRFTDSITKKTRTVPVRVQLSFPQQVGPALHVLG